MAQNPWEMDWSQPQGVQTRPADPKLPLETQRLRQQVESAGATAPYDAAKAAADARRAAAEARIAELTAAQGTQGKGLSPQIRADAISGYKTAQQLRQIIKNIQDLDAAGPGKTKGLAGLTDYLPLTSNQRLDAAGNAARGIVGQALGFTGGQLNTATEAAMAVGPYLPNAADRDDVRADKIRRLSELADLAEQRAVAQLGGIPDNNGNIVPVKKQEEPAALPGQIPPSTMGPSGGTPTNDPSGNREFSTEVDKAFAAEAQRAFNDGADRRQLDAIAKKYGAPAFGPDLDSAIQSRRAGRRGIQFSTPTTGREGAGLTGQILGGMAGSPMGSYAIGAGNALTAGMLDEIVGASGGNQAITQVAKEMAARDNPTASILGSATGGALATALPEMALTRLGIGGGAGMLAPRALGLDAAYGGAYGAGEQNDNRALGALGGAAAGAAGGIAGRGMIGSVGRAARGVRNATVRRLGDAGVPMTLGQITSQSGRVGQMAKGVEDRLAGLPFVGDMINARRLEGLQGFNRAAFNEALQPIGANTAGQIAEGGIQQAQQAVGQSYDDALRGVNVTPDAPFVQQMRGVRTNAGAIPNHGPALTHTLDNELGSLFGNNGQLSGENLQAAIQTLRGEAPTYQGTPLGAAATGALRDAEGAITGLVGRQSPDTMPALQNANRAYRNLQILQGAVGESGKNTDGIFTPAQLNMKAVQNTRSFGGRAANARGDRPFFQLGRDAQEVLPSKVPDSGTAGRLALPAVLGAGGAAGGYAYGDTKKGAAIGLALGLPATRVGQRALQAGLLARPDQMVRVGDMLVNRQALAGAFGRGALLPALLGMPQGY